MGNLASNNVNMETSSDADGVQVQGNLDNELEEVDPPPAADPVTFSLINVDVRPRRRRRHRHSVAVVEADEGLDEQEEEDSPTPAAPVAHRLVDVNVNVATETSLIDVSPSLAAVPPPPAIVSQ